MRKYELHLSVKKPKGHHFPSNVTEKLTNRGSLLFLNIPPVNAGAIHMPLQLQLNVHIELKSN